MTVPRLIALAGCALSALVVIALASPRATTSAATGQTTSVIADCSKGSGIGRGNLSAFASQNNLVVGPLAMSGAAVTPAHYSEAFGGNKFPVYVLAGHRVRVELSLQTRRGAGLAYSPRSAGPIPARGYRSITFIACRRGQFSPGLGSAAGRVSFWSGGVLADSPRCVPLRFWVDDDRRPRKAVISLGVEGCS